MFQDFPYDRDVCFSCDEDFEVLAAKYQAFHDLGARVLMLSLDDVVKVSTHPEDAQRFGTGDAAYGHMTAFLANRLQARFTDSTLIFGPPEFSSEIALAPGQKTIKLVVSDAGGFRTARTYEVVP